MHANLFTAKFQARLLLRRRLRQWSFVWLALVVLGGAWTLACVPSLVSSRRSLEAAEAESEPTRAVLSEIAAMEGELAAEEQRTERLLPFGPDERPLAVLGALVEATRASESRLYIRSLTYTNASPLGATAKAGETTGSTLVVEGVSLDDESVDRFVNDLVKTGEVTHVELKSCVREAAPSAPAPANPASNPAGGAAAPSPAPVDRPLERLRFEIHCRT
jgi:hypothetical protein